MLQPRRRPRAALGAALCAVAAVCHQSAGFLAAPGVALGLRPSPGSAAVAGCEVLQSPRGESPVVMRGHARWTHPPRDRPPRTRQSGSGRKPIYLKRKPCLAYATARKPGDTGGGRPEPGGVVLRRMWDMYDQDYNKMCALRQKYHWGAGDQSRWIKWTHDFQCQLGRRKNQQRLRREADATWANYMATTGKRLGLQDPIVYDGPSVQITQEEDEQSDPKYVEKNKPAPMGMYEMVKMRRKLKFEHPVWEEMKPGNWPEDEGQPDWIFRLFKRPLKKDPYDIPRYTSGKVKARGIVF